MPYRAMLFTLVTTVVALLAAGMWVRAVSPMLAAATDAIEAAHMTATNPATAPRPATRPESYVNLRKVIRGTLLLAFLLICFLLVVGLFATSREWVRYTTTRKEIRQGHKTRYVDAWKLAGERLKQKDSDPPSENSPDKDPNA
jgi:hypothetical protein